MGVNSLPKTVTRQRRFCDLNPVHSAPESSTLTTWLPSHQSRITYIVYNWFNNRRQFCVEISSRSSYQSDGDGEPIAGRRDVALDDDFVQSLDAARPLLYLHRQSAFVRRPVIDDLHLTLPPFRRHTSSKGQQVNSALHPSGVAKSSTSLRWGKGGNVTSAGWQVTLSDPMSHVSSRSGVATLRTAIHLLLTYLLVTL